MSHSLQPVDQLVPGANLGAYVQAVSSIPVLSIERERELADAAKSAAASDAATASE